LFSRAGPLAPDGVWHQRLATLPVAIIQFLLPWLVLAEPVAWGADAPNGARFLPARSRAVAWRTIAAAVAITLVGIVSTGATYIADRYMHPLVLSHPWRFFRHWPSTGPSQDLMRGIATACAALTAGYLGDHARNAAGHWAAGWRLFHLWPLRWARDGAAGPRARGATFVTADEGPPANIRVFLAAGAR